MFEEALRQKSRAAVWVLTKRRSSAEPLLRRRRAALDVGGTQRPSINCLRAAAVTHNVELTGPRRQTAMPARSNMDLGAARAWTAAVGGPVERHVRPRWCCPPCHLAPRSSQRQTERKQARGKHA